MATSSAAWEADWDARRESPAEALAAMVGAARRVAVLTGAGLSAGSGLQTYRGRDGRWKTEEPVQHWQFLHDRALREVQWRRSLADAEAFLAAEPNAGHRALVRLAAARDVVLMTQNVDGLHLRSGLPAHRLLELHGEGINARCLKCGGLTPVLSHAATVEAGRPPRCEADGQLLKPDVTLFGAALDRRVMALAEKAAAGCDLFLCVGTSLSVHPAANLPRLAKRAGARLVVMVDAPTQADGIADLVVRDDVSAVLDAAMGIAFPA